MVYYTEIRKHRQTYKLKRYVIIIFPYIFDVY